MKMYYILLDIWIDYLFLMIWKYKISFLKFLFIDDVLYYFIDILMFDIIFM